MNRKQLVNAVRLDLGVTYKEAEMAIDSVINAITEGMVNDGKVSIVGFGTFSVIERGARICRNPQTGEKFAIEAKNAPKFKASASLKEKVL